MIVESYEDVIVLSGALRSNYWETLHTAISLTLKRHPAGVIIDCSGITEATEAGAETFHDVIEYTRNHAARVLLAAVPPNILEVLRSVAEVRSQLAIADSIEDARRSLDLLATQAPAKRKPSQPAATRILLWLTGEDVDRQAIGVAQDLAEARDAELHLAYIVVVPRELPLTAPLPREEGIASSAITKGQAQLNKAIKWVPHVERGRDVAGTLESIVSSKKTSLVIIPISPDPKDAETRAALIRAVMQKIPEQVILVRGAKTNGA